MPEPVTLSATHLHTSLSELAVTLPRASRVFQKHGLDFCCQGKRSLETACAELQLNPRLVLAEILQAQAAPQNYQELSLHQLVEHVIERYHVTARRELPDLLEMATRVEHRHAERPGCPLGLAQLLDQWGSDLLFHMHKEEAVLFPLFLAKKGAQARLPVHAMEAEHVEHGQALQEIRRLTNQLTPPESACATWRALYLRLSEFERDLMEHVAFEQSVLFPRGLAHNEPEEQLS